MLAGDDPPCQVQSQPNTFLRCYFLCPVESAEHVVIVFFRDTDPGVCDVDPGVELPGADADMDRSAGRGVFYSVIKDVPQGFRGPFGVVTDTDRAVAVNIKLNFF